jgi:quinol monooxygenase YgiN
MFALVVRFKARKDKEKELEQMIREMTEKVRKNEKDTLMYDLHRKIGDSTDILLYERYTDKNAWEVTHCSTPYFKALLDALSQYIEGETELTEYEVVGVL